jgi:hypothetical protein
VHQDDFILAGDRDQSAIRITANRGNAVGDARTKPEQETLDMDLLAVETFVHLCVIVGNNQRIESSAVANPWLYGIWLCHIYVFSACFFGSTAIPCIASISNPWIKALPQTSRMSIGSHPRGNQLSTHQVLMAW